jgi:ketosteroid isomerase-like protein
MSNLDELEAIKQLKYRYLRFLDTKQWEALGALLTHDCATSYDSGRFSCNGRAEVIAFLEKSMGSHAVLSKHHVHHPELELLNARSARGVWYLEDTVFDYRNKLRVDGTALYFDRYRKNSDGSWRIAHTGYQRIWYRAEKLDDSRVLEKRSMFDPAERQRSAEAERPSDEAQLFAAWDA